MKWMEIILRPDSGFGTPLKGDTLFGHICWQAANDPNLLDGGLERWLDCYDDRPFAVVSSAYPRFGAVGTIRYALKRPDLSPKRLFPAGPGDDRKGMIQNRKDNQRRKWVLVGEDMNLDVLNLDLRTDDELADLIRQGGNGAEPPGLQATRGLHAVLDRPHNTINRQTGTTGEGAFAPFTETAVFYCPGTELAIFVLFEEKATDQDRLAGAVASIGRFGFGRDASTGSGRFTVLNAALRNPPKSKDADACLALAPVIPAAGTCRDVMFTPFTRYGRHGDVLARSENPFKNPVIMADEGAVLVPDGREPFLKPYIGRAVRGVSKSLLKAVVQGFAPYIPFRLES